MNSSIEKGIHVIVDGGPKPIVVAIRSRSTRDSKMFNNLYDKMKRNLRGSMGIQHTIQVRKGLSLRGIEPRQTYL